MVLQEIRNRIDAIDDELVQLFARRMDCSREVALAKQQSARPIRDHARERAIVNRLTAAAGDGLAPYVRALYAQIFDLSRSYQSALWERHSPLVDEISAAIEGTEGRGLPEHALVACQGTEGAYGQQATPTYSTSTASTACSTPWRRACAATGYCPSKTAPPAPSPRCTT